MRRIVLGAALSMVLGVGMLAARSAPAPAYADEAVPAGPDRHKLVTVDYTEYRWWLTRWEDNSVACEIYVEHPGVPDANEVFKACGSTVYNDWIKSSQPCSDQALEAENCKGYYFQLVSAIEKQKQISVELPPPEVWISLEDCVPHPAGGCVGQPTLVLTAEEPLPNERIVSIEGTVGGEPFHCDGNTCDFQLYVTPPEGAKMEFWANSSYGDTSEKFEAQVRVQADIPEGQPGGTPTWYVSVLSTQWKGDLSQSCAEQWQSFPPASGLPAWLTTPNTPNELASDLPYTYLAGNLIYQGIVDASSCPDGGLLANGAASPCGMTLARDKVTEWQNQYDHLILKTAIDTGIPAGLLKSMFSRESQLWPGLYRNVEEAGLGQLTDNGADTTLLWNVDFYKEFCPLVLYQSTCDLSYIRLSDYHKELLQAALVQSVDLFCYNCPAGLDLSKLDFSIEVFGQSLLASCSQTGQVVFNVTRQTPGAVATYPDLWKFTLTDYNAGPGCLTDAITATKNANLALTWENVSQKLEPACQGAIGYVNDITSLVTYPTPLPTPLGPTATPVHVRPNVTPTLTPIYVAPTITVTPPATPDP
jgi:hypothetical protein